MRGRRAWVVAGLAGVLAFVVRIARGGGLVGLRAYQGYDDGVYYAAAASLVHGNVPYRDFVLLHPPGVMLVLAPFAELGRWVGDADGVLLSRLAFVLVGVLNTVLVVRLATRWGMASAVTAGALYAVLPIAAGSEYITLIEPLGTAAVLGAVVLLRRGTPAAVLAGGAVLGLAPTTKIWGVVPVVVVLAWLVVTRGWPVAARATGAAAGSFLLVVGPFAALAGARMWQLVVRDQLGRPRYPGTLVDRLEQILDVRHSGLGPDAAGRTWLVVLVGTVVVLAAVAAWRARRERLWVVMLAVQLGVLVASPSFLWHYASFAAAALVLVVAAGASTMPVPVRAPVAVAASLVLVLATGPWFPTHVKAFPVARLEALLPADGCIRTDSPGTLALLGRLSRELDEGCDIPVDVSGVSYGAGSRDPHGRPVSRLDNRVWQAVAARYYGSGAATLLVRGAIPQGIAPGTRDDIERGRRVVQVDGVTLVLPPERTTAG